LILHREHLLVDSGNNLIAQALCLPLACSITVAQPMPLLLPFEFLRFPIQDPDPIPDVPVGPVAILLQHRRHLMFSLCHSFSCEWLGKD
jgi:hypothetical protein